ncbi:MAG: hypothetical protein LUQ69_02540 [Methanoregulaceae archaeon]|nr:hypothetical protein [Methanoregulaceae archaeon]
MEQEMIQILELVAALVMAVIALWQNRQKSRAELAEQDALAGMHLAGVLQGQAERESTEIVSFFDPQDDRVTSPPETVPARSWKMSDETKRWVTFGHKPDEQASLLKQIAGAEELKKSTYFIAVPGCWYEIEYGLLKGGGKG